MGNYNDLIKSKSQRTLTAKGVKFVWKCIDLIARQNNYNRYSPEIKSVKIKLRRVLEDLIIDKEKSIDQIKELIRSRYINKGIEK